MRFDLHTHTTASDGTLTPDLLVAKALEAGLRALAITDHDSIEAIGPAIARARDTDLIVIPGVELSTAEDGVDIHILGYFVDTRDARLLQTLAGLREARRARARAMVAALNRDGVSVRFDTVETLARGGAVGRSHVARALVADGHADSVADAFDRLLGRGRPYYRPKPPTDPALAVASIVRAGGIPVLAHPGITGVDHLIPGLIEAGLRGLEAYHADHDEQQRRFYDSLARQHGLLVTGGSDFHGITNAGGDLGGVRMPAHVLTDLLDAGSVRS
jgi:hypothetical protein